MRILITNDDGIRSAGIRALADACIRHGHEVYVAAPREQCSANSQHITLFGPIRVFDQHWENAQAYAVQGTPADCVRVCGQLFEGVRFDLCLSGINNGENVGSGIYYSGTFSAAREAAMMYIPSVAVSIERKASPDMLAAAAERAMCIAEKYAEEVLPRMTVLNLNYPATGPEGWEKEIVCPLSSAYYVDTYETRVDPYGNRYFWLAPAEHIEEPQEGSDLWLLRRGKPTCTLIGPLECKNDAEGLKERILR